MYLEWVSHDMFLNLYLLDLDYICLTLFIDIYQILIESELNSYILT